MTHQSQTTIDHETIKRWAEDRGGRPAVVKNQYNEPTELLRFDFGESDDALEEISWERFFELLEEHELAMVFQEQLGSGQTSRFFKFINR